MRTHKIKLYKFNELSDDAKQKALEELYDINVNYEWYDAVYYDADTIGLKITSFDTYKKDISGSLTDSMEYSIKEIKTNHGESCETYRIADEYKAKLKELRDITLDDDLPDLEDELEAEFEKELLQEYLNILEKDYEYLTSEEAILETIEANDYEFTADGKLF